MTMAWTARNAKEGNEKTRMIHDDSSTTMAARTYIADSEVTEDEVTEPIHINDEFDDVFGSGPGSPIFPSQDDLESPPAERKRGNSEISDIPRLKEKHETEGYRDGVTKGKAESVQKGFDEGYSLGATLGLRIGKILGLLEGFLRALESAVRADTNEKDKEWETQSVRMKALWKEAREELKTESVFGRQWWGEDGIWKFEVAGDGEEREVTFQDVAAAHPLVRKWEKVIQDEVERWGLDLGVLDVGNDENDMGKAETMVEEEGPATAAPGAAKELAW